MELLKPFVLNLNQRATIKNLNNKLEKRQISKSQYNVGIEQMRRRLAQLAEEQPSRKLEFLRQHVELHKLKFSL